MNFINKDFLNQKTKIIIKLILLIAIPFFTSFKINTVKFYTNSDGLSDSRIIDLAQDQLGQLWVITGNSVSVFNGSYWKNFSTKFKHQNNPFNNYLIDYRKIVIDKYDNKFLLSTDGRVFRLSKDNLTELASPLRSKGISFTNFQLVDDNDKHTIWVSTTDNGLAYYDNSWFTFTTQEGLFSNQIIDIFSNGDLLVVITKNGLQFIRQKRVIYSFQQFDFKNLKRISVAFDQKYFLKDRIPALWLLADNRLYKFENEKVNEVTNLFFNPLRENYSKVYTNGGNKLYLIGKEYVKIVNLLTGEKEVLNKENEIDGTPQVVFVDRERNLWIGTNKRLVRINFTNIIHYSEEDGLSNSRVISLAKVGNDFYIGHPQGQMTLLSNSRFYQLNFENQLSAYIQGESQQSFDIMKIIHHQNRILFLAGSVGIFEISSYRNIKPVYVVKSKSDLINDFVLLSDGGILVCGKFFDGSTTRNFMVINSNISIPHNDILESKQPVKLFKLRDGSIWITTDGPDVFKLYRNKIEHFNFLDINQFERIYSISEDRGSNVFIAGTNGFVVLMKSGEIKSYNINQNNDINGNIEVYSFHFDEYNNVWLLTNKGVRFWNWKEFKFSYLWRNIIPNKHNTNAVSEFNGKILVFAENGLFVLPGLEEEIIDVLPQVYVQEIIANGISYDNLGTIELKDKSNITFRFNAVMLSTNNIEFSYKLEGYDNNWSPPTTTREVHYLNLSEGEYRFLVRARTNFTEWTLPVTTNLIKVKSPIFYQYKFIIPVIIFLIASVILIRYYFSKKKVLNQDLTSLQRQIEGLEKQNKQLRHEINRALEISKSRMTFLASLSHELRTPITSIIGFIDIILDSKFKLSEEEKLKYLNFISANSRRLLILVNDVIDLAKVESGTVTLDFSELNLNAEVRDVVNLYREKIRAKQLDLIFELDSELETQLVSLDRNRLHQIISNLLTNAIKFTEEGYIKISTKKEVDKILLIVEDTGIGIPEKEIDFIFEEFRRTTNVIRKSIEGTGLGLPITKRLVELMGGEIKVESQEGIGSTFTVIFYPKREATKKIGSNIRRQEYN